MSATLDRVEHAEELPEEWDALATEIYQKREFLRHCQMYNPSRQRYYLVAENGTLRVGAIVYTLRLDLFTYLGLRSPMTMQIIGIPASVSSAGMLGDPALYGESLGRILQYERGLVACLNLDGVPADSPMYAGRTWPDIVIRNRFGSWKEYLSALRSDYRRRVLRVQQNSAAFVVRTSSCTTFTDELHALYLEVLKHSEGKLERLEAAFFRNLPGSFCLSTYDGGGKIRGWTITARDKDRFYFFLGGQDYSYSPKSLYLVKLMDVVKAGVESGAALIDLGQSAEIPKMRLGGRPREKVMLAYHHRRLPGFMLRSGMGILSYRKHFPDTHVFKGAVA